MTDTTPRAGVPLLAASQAQKHVTHNEALLEFDALICARILDRDLSAPPASPADGDTYLVKATATGAWAGQDGKLAYAIDGGWRFYAPFAGLSAFIADELVMLVYTGSGWTDWASLLDLQNLPELGVGTAADATNKLAVKSSALLFDNIGGGVQAKLNKHAAADTASILYQTNYSGRAEIGLTADDDFHVKVSPDGTAWATGLVIDRSTGAVSLPNGAVLSGTTTLPGSGQISSAGYIGIGCAPAYPLMMQVNAAGSQILQYARNLSADPTASSRSVWYNDAGHYAFLQFNSSTASTPDRFGFVSSAGDLLFSPGFANAIYANASGNVAIGGTSIISGARLDVNGAIYPHADNTYNLGSASYRFATVYAGTGAINTSGAQTKTGTRAFSAAELEVAKSLAANVRIFRFADAVAKKGANGARLHTGMIYEDVVAAFSAHGLDPARYGIVCADPAFKTVVTPVLGSDGAPALDVDTGLPLTREETVPDVDAGGAQKQVAGLRYDELAQFVMAGLHARLAALEAGR